MGESTMLYLLEKLTGFIKNKILGFSDDEFERVRIEMESLRAILHDADEFEEGEEGLKVWLQQIREAIQDCEDAFDELLILQTHDHGVPMFCKIPCCVKNMKGQYRLSSRLREINMKIELITKELTRQEEKLGRIEQASKSKYAISQGDALLLEKSNLVGIDRPKEQLIQWLFNGSWDREVISLAAMGGMGKTTLAKQVYDDPKVKKHFKTHAWITVSQFLEEQELLIDMVQQLYQVSRRRPPKDWESFKAQRLKEIIMDLLSGGRYLIVLDDIWHLNEWTDLQHMLTNNKNGSRVMLTTQKIDIASSSSVDNLDKVYHLKPLSPKESWELFCKKTFRHNEECPPYLKEICEYILKRCEGLPLAIVAISNVLATKRRENIEEWYMICCSLGSKINALDEFKQLKTVLSLSFNDLPYYLKPCFLYITIFPENHLIERARLVRLWIAEGFVAVKEGETQEDVADDYFNELLNRNLIQSVRTTADGAVKKCRVHNLLREFLITKSRDQNVAILAKDQNVQWSDKIRRLSIHNMQQNVQWSDKIRCLSIHNMQQNVHQKRSISRLRSFFMFGVKEKPRMNVLSPNGFRLLKVFDLQSSHMKKFPVEIRDLSLLKYLSLRNTWVEIIPSFIGKLKNLETLDLKHSFVSELPIEILNLQRLRHILIYRIEHESYLHFHNKIGFKAHANIGRLTSLQKLRFIEANQDDGVIVEELGRLTQLRSLGILKLKKEDEKALCSSIEKLVNLRALSITANDENEIIDLQHLSSPPLLIQRLYLKGRMHTLPPWILSLHGLVRLHLTWSHLKDDPLVFLQNLPNLIHLELLQACKGKTLCFHSGGFKKLKLLTIDEFNELQCLEVEKGAMPCVQKLNIQRCKQLWRVPSGIAHLTTLEVLEFLEMPKELMKTLHPDGTGDDYQKVAFIPQVIFTFWEDDVWKVQSLASLRKRNSPAQCSDKKVIESRSRQK